MKFWKTLKYGVADKHPPYPKWFVFDTSTKDSTMRSQRCTFQGKRYCLFVSGNSAQDWGGVILREDGYPGMLILQELFDLLPLAMERFDHVATHLEEVLMEEAL